MDGHSRSDSRSERYRLFVAIALPEPVRHAIEKAQGELRAALPAKSIRWTHSEQFHLTMRFLGGVEAQQVDRLTDAVRRACDEGDFVSDLHGASGPPALFQASTPPCR